MFRQYQTVIITFWLCAFFAGCASVTRIESESTPGAYYVSVSKTLFSDAPQMQSSAHRKDVILSKETKLELLETDGIAARVRLEDGREGFVFRNDIAPLLSTPNAAELRNNLRFSGHPSDEENATYEIPEKKEIPPVDRTLIKQADDVEMPTINPLLSIPNTE